MPIVNLTTSFLGIIPPNDPVVTFVSATGDSITVNITNPNEYSVKAYYGHTNPNPTLNTTISANSNQNVTVSGLTSGTNYTIYVYLENTENNSKSATVSVLASTLAELYAFSSHTFTNAGATGRLGPTIAQVRSAYSSVAWTQNNDYLSMTTQGIQQWKVPSDGTYRITTAGAKGGQTAGQGGILRADYVLTQGQVLNLVVGQIGGNDPGGAGAGGGGGSFVYSGAIGSNGLLIAAGGGGGMDDGGGSGYSASSTLNPTADNTGGGTTTNDGQNGGGNYEQGGGWLAGAITAVMRGEAFGPNGRRGGEGGFGAGGDSYDDGGGGGGFTGGFSSSSAGGGAGGSYYAGLSVSGGYTSTWASSTSNFTWLGTNNDQGYIQVVKI
jgi:hypothetical protein